MYDYDIHVHIKHQGDKKTHTKTRLRGGGPSG